MPASASPRATGVPMTGDGEGLGLGFGLFSGGRSVKYGELPVAPSSPAATSDAGWESLAACLPWSSTVVPGAWDADRAATASAAAAVVAAPLRSLLPMYAAIQRTPPAGGKPPCSAWFSSGPGQSC